MYHKKTQHIDFTEGYILHKKPFEEHKLLLSIFDKSHGIIRGIARRPSAKKTSCIEPFTPLALQIKTSSGLASIQRIEPVTHHFIPPLMGAHLWAGLYCNELLYRLCHPQETYPKTFLQYEKTLQALSHRSPIRKVVRLFEYHLLQEIGFSIDFSCLDNEASWYHYCSDNGQTENIYNPNGSLKNIAGIFNKEKNVLGMMPHPERMIDQSLSGEDGSLFFKNLINNLK